MEPHQLMVLTPAGTVDPSLCIAASRAGAFGILDLEFATDSSAITAALSSLARFTSGKFGVLIRADNKAPHAAILAAAAQPTLVVLAGPDPSALIQPIRAAGCEIYREVIAIEEAIAATEIGVDAIILKGHESAGRVGADTAFVLLQKWRQHTDRHKLTVPFWVRGGIGANTAAACLAAGASGVVLDSQVLLARESPLSEPARRRLAGLDGCETTVYGTRLGEAYRIHARPDSEATSALTNEEERLLAINSTSEEKLAEWRAAIRTRISLDPSEGIWPIGQDVALAPLLAPKGITVAGIIQLICEQSTKQLEAARRLRHLSESGPLARSHGTRYPILQGPMTRVSDTASFADAVAVDGALPFLALAFLRKDETEQLLKETKTKLGRKPWGVGILGFVPNEIRAEQLEAIRLHKPPFAIIAGGRPDQAKELDSQGVTTYLHVPSPGLLRMFLKDGARRFIFEGQECGGHIGPRTSFALWETMVSVLADHIASKPANELHIIFAGGIHDALSGAMVAALSAGLADRGVKVGMLLGTAYLFTKEAVSTGAITTRFQNEALACADTALLETGPGHAIRCIPTPYVDSFEETKAKLRSEGKTALEISTALEQMNLGRLRVASKGMDRTAAGSANGTGLPPIPEDEQVRRGMYMIGQVAALRNRVATIANLHADVCRGVESADPAFIVTRPVEEPEPPPPCDVAIIGLSCFYPKAVGVWPYWENILAKVNAVIEIPPTHWDWRPYYDPNPRARDKMVSKWGGFMSDIVFDPLKYGITPRSIPNIEPLQLLLLEAVSQALGDAGYQERAFKRERTCAILGVGGGGMPLSVAYGFRACMPLLDSIPGVPVRSSQIVELGEGILPEWTEDSFPGILLNVAAGRVANRFNLGGPNMAIDAACGSSLAALYAGVRELNDGTSDVAIVMGGDAVQTPYAYVAFSKTHALSPQGRCRPFDAGADGIALAEGVGVAVLKRLSDAERDGDRIYAVIKGVGASSDGRDKGLTAPRAEGQLRALNRAYAQARLSPARVGLVEAHGTGTVVGDQTEARAIGELFRAAGGLPQSCALGSVKSMIGHSKCAAGLAGLIKTAFALHYKVLPPTLVEVPNSKANLDGGPLFLNTEPRPWVHGSEHPRTAGVSAFGFGGTNFHAVLEEYTGNYLDCADSGVRRWPAELLVWRRTSTTALFADVKSCRDALLGGAAPELANLAASLWQSSRDGIGQATLAVVAVSLDDLKEKLDASLAAIPSAGETFTDPRGIYFAARPHPGHGTVAFLFPGQGSQYPNMLAQQAMAFPEVRAVLDRAERTLARDLDRPLGKFIYPPSAFNPEQEAANRRELQRTEIAQPAVGASSLGMFRLLSALGVEGDFFAGHSYGEYVALAAAGVLSEDELIRLSYRRGRVILDVASRSPGGMIAVDATPVVIEPILKGMEGVWIANQNAPSQIVIAGTESALELAIEKLQAKNIRVQRIPVACGFHSPLISAGREPLAQELEAVTFAVPQKPVFSNTTATPHASDPGIIRQQLPEHLVSPVRFADEITAMYEAGARVFVEVGPQAVLTGLTAQILAGKPHWVIASDMKSRPGLVQLAHLLGQLLAAGVPVQLDRLYRGRGVRVFELAKLASESGKPKPAPTAWLVNGVRSRPINGPEPRLLGQPLPTTQPSGATHPSQESAKVAGKSPLNRAAPGRLPQSPQSVRSAAAPGAPASPRAMMNDPATTPALTTPSNNGTHAPPRAGPDGAAAVMLRFQDVMARFLDTQQSVMLNYLGASAQAATPVLNNPTQFPLNSNGHAAPPTPPVLVNRLNSTEPAVRMAEPVARTATSTPSGNGAPVHGAPLPEPKESQEGNGKPVPSEMNDTTASLDHEGLLARLLDLVSDRTGYPKEALSIDLDLEADLGIDSIKRVEILGALAESIGDAADGSPPSLEMEKLSVIKTLRGIADYMTEALSAATTQPSMNGSQKCETESSRNGDRHPGARHGEVQRLVVRLIDAPLPLRPRFAPPSGLIVITDDQQGTAQELADRLADLDIKTVLIRHGMLMETDPNLPFATDLTDPIAVEKLLGRIQNTCGTVAGLIHLLPIAEPVEGETIESRTWRDVKSLHLLSRGLEAEIRASGQKGSAVLLAATAMGGSMGFGTDLPANFSPGHGGVAGFTKSVAHEWPEVTVRVVDTDPETPATHLAEQLLAELADTDGPFEVGRKGDRRVTWQVEPGALSKESPAIAIRPDSTVLITGGARGITAKVALELAHRYGPKLILVGSSPLPAKESAATAGLSSHSELKAELLKRQPDGKPAAIEAAYKRLLKDREIRANLASIRAAGSTVEYRAIDVRDSAAFGALIEELNAAGGITGVIHGAGVIEDKLLRDKTTESFDRVFGTKVDSALTLARKLDPSTLKFFALFASITSRYGNRGQSDYAAANEVLSKLACNLDRSWSGRVVSIGWGPWAEVGMVADLEKHLVARGLKLIEPAAGAGFAVDEVIFGTKGEPEVLIAGGTEQPIRHNHSDEAQEPRVVGAK